MTEDPTQQQDDEGQQTGDQQGEPQQAQEQQGDAQQGEAQQAHEQQGDAQQGEAQQAHEQQGEAQHGEAQQAQGQRPEAQQPEEPPAVPQAREHPVASEAEDAPPSQLQEVSVAQSQEPPVPPPPVAQPPVGEPARAATDQPLVLPEGDEEAVHGTGAAEVGEAQVGEAQVGEAHVGEVQVGEGLVADGRVTDRVSDAPLTDARVADALVAESGVPGAQVTEDGEPNIHAAEAEPNQDQAAKAEGSEAQAAAPSEQAEDQAAAPTEQVEAQAAAPTEQAVDQAAAPTEQAEDQTVGAEESDTQATAPAEASPAAAPATIPTPAALARSARPSPGPRLATRPRPTPGPAARRPGQDAVAPVAARDAEAERQTRELAERAREWGRVAEDGAVFVRTADGERTVGSYPGASDDEALAFFARKFDELVAQLDLAEQRLSVPEAPVKDVAKTLEGLRPTVADANVVGDLEALQRRLARLDELVVVRRKEAEERRAQAKEAARVERLALVEEAEGIAATDPEKIQWKPSGDRLRTLFDQWKTAQRSGQRLDKPVEDELWKRFSQARTTFDRHRRAYFSELERRHGEVKAAKAKIVAEAEALSTSREWGPTSAAFRALMDRWKAAGRASRKDDDALWAQFRAAQDTFFSARAADQAQVDAEFRGNLEVKERLLVEAEALLPIRDIDAAKRALRSIHDRWDAAGKVPRADLGRVERRLRAVEDAVRQADEGRWRRRNPDAKARAEGALGQLEESIASLEADLYAARERGDQRAIRTAEEALSARRAWLEQVRQAASEFS